MPRLVFSRGFFTLRGEGLEAYDVAVALDAQGFCILPAKFKGKAPLISWRKYQSRRSTDDLVELFGFVQDYNFWILCGSISGCVVLDCDNPIAVRYWENKLGKELLWKTAWVETAKGYHFYFKLPEGQSFESWSSHEGEDQPSFDVRGDGTGVIAPPSVHVTGKAYSWGRKWSKALPVPAALFKGGKASPVVTAGVVGRKRTNLSELLGAPPKGEGGRNVWLTAVAGHYAKQIKFEDAFRATIETANQQMGAPLDDDEVTKICDSIWNTELSKPDAPSPKNGWLVAGAGHKLQTMVKIKDQSSEDGFRIEMQDWSDFDIQAQGVIFDEKKRRSYVVMILQEGEEPRQDLLEPQVLARGQELSVWLAGHGCTIIPPLTDPHKSSRTERLQRYLESQEPPEFRGVAYLGWHDGIGFVVHEGIITPNGLIPHEGVMPHPRLRSWAPYRYGFAGEEETRQVLREVLTFQDPIVTAVYASWWCSNILKGQEGFGSAHWPAMVNEASSESGKTRGFFALINALFGCTQGGGEATMAATRDALSAHRNGLVWADDLEDPTGLMELVRQATSEGSKSKKGMNRSDQETVKLVCPVCISGESMGAIMAEKAQRDRAIRLTVPSPINRRSEHGDYPQFDDLEDLLNRYGRDLTRLAGTMVQLVLQQAHLTKEFRRLRGDAGRHNDKHGVLRVGALVLAEITGNPKVIDLVDEWCRNDENLGDENVLTTLVLPQLLAAGNLTRNAFGAPPVFYRDGVIWLHIQKVVLEWQRMTRIGDRSRDLVSQSSILSQLKALKSDKNRRWSVMPQIRGEAPKQMFYHALSEPISALVMSRAESLPSGNDTFREKAADEMTHYKEPRVITGVITKKGLKSHPLYPKKHPRMVL